MAGPDTLHRWPREADWHYRALLLWAMQTEGFEVQGECGRSAKEIARVLGKERVTVLRVKREKRWGARLLGHADAVGEDPQEYAAQAYRATFLPAHGPQDLPGLAHTMAERLVHIAKGGPHAPTKGTTAAQEAASELLRGMTPTTPEVDPGELEQMQAAIDDAMGRKLQRNGQYSELLTLLVDDFKKRLSHKDPKQRPRIRPRDLPMVIAQMRELDEERERIVNPGGTEEADGPVVQETVRVSIARRRGGNVRAAIRDDVRELALVLDQLEASEQQAEIELQVIEGQAV